MDQDRRDLGLGGTQGAQVGDGNRQYNFFNGVLSAGLRPGAYREQVRRIAPPELAGREAELAELVGFCVDPAAGAYVWWQAGPWAGKSALLSSFVLRPPPEVGARVRLVSFFITARLAAQDTREAFIQVLLEQLAELTGERLPAVLPEPTREAFLLDLMSQAAAGCEAAGGRLVLVVDGLDEDRGVTAGPGACSIAGLLPASPPHGMRVIVAGRPNPPVPDDVPDWHPLRDPRIIRQLPASAYAWDMKRLSSAELQRLLRGSAAEQDVLGLLAAARGGLSARDLEELAGVPLWDVEQVLHTAAGRTFTRRASQWAPQARPETYLLGHEELQAVAMSYLGSGRLAGHRDRLHAWAGGYRARGWPTGTPEYLLSGYYRLLTDLGDLPRMTECGGDRARHDRMRDLTGGDAAALAETRTDLDRAAAQELPDLATVLALAGHRDRLVARNRSIPVRLPGVWAVLGHVSRAEAIAASVADPLERAAALAGIAEALAGAGDQENAASAAGRAEATALSIHSPSTRARALGCIAVALAKAGWHEQAEMIAAQAQVIASYIGAPDEHARVLAYGAETLARAGQPGRAASIAKQAEAVAQALANPDAHGVLAETARASAWAGRQEHAEVVARSIADSYWQSVALAGVVEALAWAGRQEQAAAAARQVEAVARSITDSDYWQSLALMIAAGAWACTGRWEHAETLTRSMHDDQRSGSLTSVAEALARAGQYEHAAAVAGQAEAIAARSTARTATFEKDLAGVAVSLARAGRHEHAAVIAARAEKATSGIPHAGWQGTCTAAVAEAWAWAGRHEHAEAVARSITDAYRQVQALAGVSEALARTGQHERATVIAGQAEAVARSITRPDMQAHAVACVARALARGGQHEHSVVLAEEAETAVSSITGPSWRPPWILAGIAGAWAWAGEHEHADALARSIADPDGQAQAKADIAGALAHAGQHDNAETIARSITEPGMQAQALAQVAEALASAGDTRRGTVVAADVCALSDWIVAVTPVLKLAPSTLPLVMSMAETLSYKP